MDYTTLEQVKAILGAEKVTHDELLAGFITAASREFDRRCTGVARPEAHDYFTLADVSDQVLRAQVDVQGCLLCWPRKPVVNSVSALAYRLNPLGSWIEVDPTKFVSFDGILVTAWVNLISQRGNRNLQAKISFNGGFADEPGDLPADLVEAVTVLAVRFYREGETGLTDSIGVAELGTLTYTKALPVRVKETIRQYQRTAPW
jgi:hypothetical protein